MILLITSLLSSKPYFKWENAREGAFAVANKLYGITLSKLEDIPTYHPDVEVFEVKDADGVDLRGKFYKITYNIGAGSSFVFALGEQAVQCMSAEVLKMYAKHYATGKVIPDEIIEKILQQKTFNQGFMTTELLAAAILRNNSAVFLSKIPCSLKASKASLSSTLAHR